MNKKILALVISIIAIIAVCAVIALQTMGNTNNILSDKVVTINYTLNEGNDHSESEDFDGIIADHLSFESNYNVTIDLGKLQLQHEGDEPISNNVGSCDLTLIAGKAEVWFINAYLGYKANGSPLDYEIVYDDPSIKVVLNNQTP